MPVLLHNRGLLRVIGPGVATHVTGLGIETTAEVETRTVLGAHRGARWRVW
ncbi:hypothetical protein [Amycolatopsis sp. DG1A-15b]|uniref:hypothetical protein n=1 Tax=Amycolatopsis sp. DG1A-15b TaxID=3052846 RepID=UPI00255C2431|nr:hypothetical protein [Amycolatopsis sp. DG1A-15b]WIX91323.1 hypothetical protein QRY02_13075 [Amycolatopsis sp. DG1A-15b]